MFGCDENPHKMPLKIISSTGKGMFIVAIVSPVPEEKFKFTILIVFIYGVLKVIFFFNYKRDNILFFYFIVYNKYETI